MLSHTAQSNKKRTENHQQMQENGGETSERKSGAFEVSNICEIPLENRAKTKRKIRGEMPKEKDGGQRSGAVSIVLDIFRTCDFVGG